jgi:hypothetical protein
MGRAYIETLDIDDTGVLTVAGQLSRTGLVAHLHQRVYVHPPADGIYEYDLVVRSTSDMGAMVLVPFAASAEGPGPEASGVRVYQQLHDRLDSTTLMQIRKVSSHADHNVNQVLLDGLAVDRHGRLVIDLRYGGGCRTHALSVDWDGLTLESNPVQYVLQVVDEGPFDPCKGLIPMQLRVDLDVPDVSFDRPSVLVVRTPSGSQLRLPLD